MADDMPPERVKVFHTQGVVTRVKYQSVGDHPYTGIFKGANFGIMRITDVTRINPDVPLTSPGFGIKWLRDDYPSANGVTMFSFNG